MREPEDIRDVNRLTVLRVGRVGCGTGDLPWTVFGPDGTEFEPVSRWLTDLWAGDYAPATLRSYAYDLLAWLRLLEAMQIDWTHASRWEIRDAVRWFRVAPNGQRQRSNSAAGRPEPGSVNQRTGKPYLSPGYAPATIDHFLSTVSEFYRFAIDTSLGPLINPVPVASARALRDPRRNGPMDASIPGRRAAYRQKRQQVTPRAIPDELFTELFDKMNTPRDRAIVTIAVSSGARASELLSMRPAGVDVADATIEVIPKGRRHWERVRVGPDALLWTSLYLDERPSGWGPSEPLWLSCRGKPRPMTYWSLRQVLERANAALGTNFTWHDLRHTYAHRLASDPAMLITDVQELMRHRSVSTTATYLQARTEDLVNRLAAHHARPTRPLVRAAAGYAARDMAVLFPDLARAEQPTPQVPR